QLRVLRLRGQRPAHEPPELVERRQLLALLRRELPVERLGLVPAELSVVEPQQLLVPWLHLLCRPTRPPPQQGVGLARPRASPRSRGAAPACASARGTAGS